MRTFLERVNAALPSGWGHCFALRKLTNLSPQTAVEEQMAQSKEERNHSGNSLTTWGVPGAFTNPMLAMLADLSGTLLEVVATAHKEWFEFVHRRVREDVAVSRQLLNCKSPADMHGAR